LDIALAVIVYVLGVKEAVTVVLALIVKEQVGDVPVHPPDQPEKVELVSGVAVSDTTVPGLKVAPVGLEVIVPLPVPALARVREYVRTLVCVTVDVFPAIVKVADLGVAAEFLETE
jgi:hypothetical protein